MQYGYRRNPIAAKQQVDKVMATEIDEIIIKETSSSNAHPTKTGPNADANTDSTAPAARIAPKCSVPYNSAHKDEKVGFDDPALRPIKLKTPIAQ